MEINGRFDAQIQKKLWASQRQAYIHIAELLSLSKLYGEQVGKISKRKVLFHPNYVLQYRNPFTHISWTSTGRQNQLNWTLDLEEPLLCSQIKLRDKTW